MKDKLKRFVEQNRQDFELEPSPAISPDSTSFKSASKRKIKRLNIKKMIKYGFGASALVVGSMLGFHLIHNHTEHLPKVSPSKLFNTHMEDPVNHTLEAPKVNKPQLAALAAQSGSVNAGEEKINPPDSITINETLPIAPPPLPLQPPDSSDLTSKQVPIEMAQIDTFFKSIKQIKINAKFCKVQFNGTKDAQTHLRANFPEGSGTMLQLGTKCYVTSIVELKYSIENTILTIWVEESDLPKRRQIKLGHQNAFIVIDLPAGVAAEVENESGSISAENLTADSFRFYAHFGNLNLQNINGRLDLKARSGHVKCYGIRGDVKSTGDFGSMTFDDIRGQLDLICNSGNIKVNNLNGKADVRTSFGTQQYNNVQGAVKAITSSGSIKMFSVKGNFDCVSSFGNLIFDNVEGDISAQASSGSIRMNSVTGSLQLNTSFGNIKGDQVKLLTSARLKASSGNISIDFLNEMSDLKFDLSSSSGKISISDHGETKQAEHSLSYGNGKVLITAITTFGSQNFR